MKLQEMDLFAEMNSFKSKLARKIKRGIWTLFDQSIIFTVNGGFPSYRTVRLFWAIYHCLEFG